MARQKTTRYEQTIVWIASLGFLWIGCNQAAGIREGEPYPDACKTVADCDQGVPECRTVSCQDERCVYKDAPEGTRLSQQIIGDCLEEQCDGQGRTRKIPVESDIEDDKQPCTADTCVGTEPRHTPLSAVPCYTGMAGTELLGNCKKGFQTCKDGLPVGACIGERIPTQETCLTIFDDDCDGNVNEEGPGCVCLPGSIGTCYPGQQENLGYGACAAGTQACNTLGTAYDACIGFTGPLPETCDVQQKDEDCDGLLNEEGTDCKCGDGFISGTEICDDGNAIDTDACSNECRIPGCGNGSKDANEECDDGNSEIFDECTNQCTWNKCILNEVVCMPIDACHNAGTCDPFTGICTNPPAPNGTSCDDGVECTDTMCMDGQCAAAPAANGSDCTCGQCNAGACSSKLIGTTVDPNIMQVPLPTSLATDGSTLYFANSYYGSAMQASVGALTLAPLTKQFFAKGLTGYPQINSGGANVYYTLGTTIWSQPKAGGMPQVLDTLQSINGLTSDTLNVYAADTTGGNIVAYSIMNGTPTILASNESSPRNVISDGTNVYWVNDNVRIRTMPIAAGTPTVLVSDQSNIFHIALDETNIYWINATSMTINKMPLAGGTITTLATDMLGPRNLTAANGHVYWTNYASGASNQAFVQKIQASGNGAPTLIPPKLTGLSVITHDNQCVYWFDIYGNTYSAPQ